VAGGEGKMSWSSGSSAPGFHAAAGRRRGVVCGVSGEPHGVRASEALPLQSSQEGVKMDLVEWAESWQEVLLLRGCNGE
jgi:hypothetical protein